MTSSLTSFSGIGTGSAFMAPQAQDRLVRKEVALGQLRDIEPPQDHIGLSLIAPWLEIASDDAVFDYVPIQADGLAPARAEDAESELAMKDDYTRGQGRVSTIDWSIKDHYTASDVTRYREYQRLAELAAANNGAFPLTVTSMTEDFASKLARDAASRRRKLDNRIEWLITQGLANGSISYNDGKISFNVNYGRPAGQTAQAPASGTYAGKNHDPINDIIAVQQYMDDTQGVQIDRAIVSKKFLFRAAQASLFGLRAGFVPDGSGGVTTADPRYLLDGYGQDYAINMLKNATGLDFIVYDSVYRTRALGATTTVNNRFIAQNKVIFLPSTASLSEFDDTAIGFAKTLTSPHPEGNWGSGFYEWEQETRDPWGVDRGTGVKAFPAFLHLDKTYTMDVTL